MSSLKLKQKIKTLEALVLSIELKKIGIIITSDKLEVMLLKYPMISPKELYNKIKARAEYSLINRLKRMFKK